MADTDDNSSEAMTTPEIGITAADRERIREYLKKPPHRRSLHDLRPDTETAAD